MIIKNKEILHIFINLLIYYFLGGFVYSQMGFLGLIFIGILTILFFILIIEIRGLYEYSN